MGGFRDHKSHLQVDGSLSGGKQWFKTTLPSLIYSEEITFVSLETGLG